MKLNTILRYVLSSLLAGCFLITGCSMGKNSAQVALETLSLEEEDELTDAAADSLEIREIIQEAEAHYDKGCEHYKDHRWALAQQEFDKALETLLDANVNAETHYRLGQTYDRLFYRIHKLELERNNVVKMLADEETSDEALSTEELEALLSSTQQESLAPLTPQELEVQEYFQNLEDTVGEIVVDASDPLVMKYFKQFAKENSIYRKGMQRASLYLPIIEETLKEYHLPLELMFVPMIESSYRVDAVSPTGAVGLWQFVRGTARLYGLKIDTWIDERRDPEKSTKAAAQYLYDLYQMLGDWDLALAGYYMGEYKVHNAIGKHRTRDINTLAGTRAFGRGAQNYICRFKAAVLLTQQAEQYGIILNSSAPLSYDIVEVKKGAYLKEIAEQYGTSYQELRKLNPELKKSRIPPGTGMYALKVPPGIGTIVIAENSVEQKTRQDKAQAPVEKKKVKKSLPSGDVVVYRVQRGDNLSKIARRYGVNVALLQEANDIYDVKKLQIGQKIVVPISASSKVVIAHTVQKSETLSSIARQYKTDVATLKSLNTIRNAKRLQIGQKLKVPLSKSSVLAQGDSSKTRMVTYRVKRGDSLSKIASTFGVSVRQLQKWNNIGKRTVIYPGNRLKVWY